MNPKSLKLQARSLQEMAMRKPYVKELAGFRYHVFKKVYKGGTDTELLCELLKVRKGEDVWDIGTGTGLVAIKAKRLGAYYVLATDKNSAAVINAKKNSKFLKLKIDVKKVDVFGNIKKKFDLIVFNPPFTDHPARQSHHISFWDRGHATIRKFFTRLNNHLKPNGRALICWSSFAKTSKLKRIAHEYDFLLKEEGRRKGKNGFSYYVYRIQNSK